MAVQGTREASAPVASSPAGDRRALGAPGPQDGPVSRTQLTALAAIPAAAASLLGMLGVGALAYHARTVHPVRGAVLDGVCLLGVLLLCVVLAGVVWARAVALSSANALQYRSGPGAQPPSDGRPLIADLGAGPRIPLQRPAYPPAPNPNGNLPATAASAAQTVPVIPVIPLVDPSGGDGAVFVHLSQRLQSLVHRQIELLDALENDVEEPDLLKGLFSVDHLATRMRRHAENLAVLGGAVPRRQWTRPISVMEVLRSAVSETLDYARVQVIARTPGLINGHAVADIVHLLAELVENATAYSPPDTKVVLRTYPVTAGLAVEIDDRGLGMQRPEYDRLNTLLKEPVGVSVQELLEGGRIGLYVVAQLARRHSIAVALQSNITGGTQALVVLPKVLLTEVKRDAGAPQPNALETGRQESAPPQSATATATAPAPGPAGYQQAETRSAPLPARPAHAAPVLDSAPTAPPALGQAPAEELPRRQLPRYGVDAALPAPRRPENDGPAVLTTAGRGTRPDPARPPLPRRRPQEHLADALLDGGSEPAARVGETPSPTLMADFRGGLARGASVPESANPLEHPYDQEGER
ncbi:MAG TPA: ATP-binding protein [Actinocrinis sp.]|nr:ATP-binding protein [Actinocrinis sp.]